MKDLRNKVQLIGNLGMDPEVKELENGRKLAKFSVATSQSYNNSKGEKVTDTQWHNIVAWKRLAEICSEFLSKGSKVYIEGKLQTRKWQDKDGNDRYTTEIVARDMQMLTPRGASSGGGSYGDNNGGYNDLPQEPPPNTGDDVPF